MAFTWPQQKAPQTGVFGSGTATAPAPTVFGGFGQQTATTTVSAPAASAPIFGGSGGGIGIGNSNKGFGGFGGFGQQQQQTSQPTFAFGTPANTSAPTFGSGGGTTSTGYGGFGCGFGQQQASSNKQMFGSGFGAQTQAAASNASAPTFGTSGGFVGNTSFGTPQAAGGTSSGTIPSAMSQQQQQQQQQQLEILEQAAFHQSIFGCSKFADDRDAILANLNYVQACWGGGKGFYNQTNPPISYNQNNILYRFKAVVYSYMYTEPNEEGNVILHIKKPQQKVCEEEAQLIAILQAMLVKPNMLFRISGTKAMGEDATMIVLTVDDRTTLTRVSATNLAAALLQPQFRPQLDALGVISVSPKVRPSPQQLQAYLDNVPSGLDPRLWKQAQQYNPDPQNMIPIPLVGPEALKSRLEAQKKENQQHCNRLKLIADEVGNLHNRHASISSELQNLRHRHAMVTHRIISAIGRLQLLQTQGHPIQPVEQDIKQRLQGLEKQFDSPHHFRGRLNELMAHARLYKSGLENRATAKYSMDPSALDYIKEFLNLQQGSITHLVQTVKSCMDHVERMNAGVEEFKKKQQQDSTNYQQ